MIFSHDTHQALCAATALVNTKLGLDDGLPDPLALNEFVAQHGWTGRRDRDDKELAEVHGLRARLGRIWEVANDEAKAVALVNALLTDTHASPWLTRHAEMPEWHLHLTSIHDPLAQRMGAEMAMAMADLIRSGEMRRLKVCTAQDCLAVVVDLSRNRCRIFCDTGNCGNRQHVAAFRERRSHGNSR